MGRMSNKKKEELRNKKKLIIGSSVVIILIMLFSIFKGICMFRYYIDEYERHFSTAGCTGCLFGRYYGRRSGIGEMVWWLYFDETLGFIQ